MKKPWLVVYSSVTGNTEKIARAVFQVLPEGSEIQPVQAQPDYHSYEKIALGFWADKGTADAQAAEYLNTLSNARIFLFATMGVYPDSDKGKKVLANGAALLGPGCEILGMFACHGKLAPELVAKAKQRPAHHPHAPTPERLKRWEDAASHPDGKDCLAVQNIIKALLEDL